MKVSADFGRWTKTKTALAVAGALAIGGAVGSAIAMSPTVQPPIKWAGGAEFVTAVPAGGPTVVYTVPAGRNLILTDLIIGNTNTTFNNISVFSGSAGCAEILLPRLSNIMIPAADTAYVSLQTGVGFTSGQTICIQSSNSVALSGRGFLFTPAPPS